MWFDKSYDAKSTRHQLSSTYDETEDSSDDRKSTYILLRFDHCRYGDHLLTRLTSRHSDILLDNELSSVRPLRKHPFSYELRPKNDTTIHKKTHEAPPRMKAVRSSTKGIAIALPLDVACMLVYLSLSCSNPFLLQRRRYGRQSARKHCQEARLGHEEYDVVNSGGATDEVSREQNLADDAADLSHFGVKALSQVLSVCVDAISEVFRFCGRVVVGEWRSITLSFSTRVSSRAQTDTGAITGRGTDGMRWGEACFVDTSSLACMGAFVCLGLGWRVGGQRRDDLKVVFADVRGSLRVWNEDDRAGAHYVEVCELFRSIRGAFVFVPG